MTAIQVRQLTKTFVVREKQAGLQGSIRALFRPVQREAQAVKGISFSVEEGERVAFIGPNGAGKSTTIHPHPGRLRRLPAGGPAERFQLGASGGPGRLHHRHRPGRAGRLLLGAAALHLRQPGDRARMRD